MDAVGSGVFQPMAISVDEISSRMRMGAGGISSPSFSTRSSFGVVRTDHARQKSLPQLGDAGPMGR
jgi:hypothetical protein